MFDTERNQPMRVCAVASGFSTRMLGMAKGVSTSAHAELERRLVLGIGREERKHGRRHAAMQPGDRLARRIEPRLDPLHRNGVEEVVAAGRPRASR